MSACSRLRLLVCGWVMALALTHPGSSDADRATSSTAASPVGADPIINSAGGQSLLATATGVTAFSESFEGTFSAQWTQDAQVDWFVSSQRAFAGTRSAEVDGLATSAQLISVPVNLQGRTEATVSFSWYIESGLDSGEYLAFDISTNGGSSWTERARLRADVDPENAWRTVQLQLTGLASLRLRFRGTMSASDEDANVDDVLVTLPAASTNTAPVVTSPGNRSNPAGSLVSGLAITVTDADNDPITCAISGLPAGLAETSECVIGGAITAVPGSYVVTVTASDGKSTSPAVSFTWTVTAAGTSANPETPPAPAAAPSMSPDAASSRAGATAGVFRVDESGNATYSIPIQTAPGSGGLAPKVSLNYSSQAGNGPLGVGWSIGGLSVVTRCSRSIEQDGASGKRGISLTANDRFCLDGQRLVVINGTYGGAGAEYRAEIDAISKIVSSGQAGTGPQSFTVWRKDGSVAQYGVTTDSRIEARTSSDSATALAWALNRVTDKAGNYINYVYHEFSGANGEPVEALLASINYTGNSRAATLPYAQIDFIYDANRSDTTLSAIGGARQIQSRLLKRIDSRARVTAAGSLMSLRSYLLAYHPGMDGHGRAALNSVTECSDAVKTICFPPTVFDWQRSKHQVTTVSPAMNSGVFNSQHAGLAFADINGDSRPDLLLTERYGTEEYRFRTALAQPSGSFASASTTTYSIPNNGLADAPVALHAIDLNADGLQDVIYPASSGWKARLSSASGFGAEITVASGCCGLSNPPLVRVMDFDGDGLSDLVTARATSTAGQELVFLRNRYSPASPGSVSLGAPIVLSIDATSLGLFPERSGDWFIDDEAPHFENTTSTNNAFARSLDFNGDGAVDLLVRLSQRYVQCGAGCNSNLESPAAEPVALSRFTFGAGSETTGESALGGETYALASFYLVLLSDGATAFGAPQVVATGHDCMIYDACNPYAGLPRVQRLLPVDINGDGLGDIVRQDALFDWYANLNRGGAFDPVAISIANFDGTAPWQYAASRFLDITGDGLPELIYPNLNDSASAVWQVHENLHGRGFAAAQTSAAKVGKSGERDLSILADMNGDGMVDNLFIDFNTLGEVQASTTRLFLGQNSVSGASPGNAMNLVSAVTDGMGNTRAISYKPLTDSSVYARMNDGKAAVWGAGSVVMDVVAPVYVVSQVESSAPVYNNPAAKSRVEYRYLGAKLQAGGRGFLGFGEVISWNPQTGVRTHQRFRQDYPYIGLPVDSAGFRASSTQKLDALSNTSALSPAAWAAVGANTLPPAASGTVLAYSANQWSAIETVSGKKTWAPVVVNTLERSYTLNGALNRKAHTGNVYNSFGDVTSAVTNVFAAETGSAFSTETSAHTYLAPDTANWRIGRRSASSITQARSGQSPITRQSAFGYDAVTGILNQEVDEPNNTAFKVVTNYQLDSFGNRTSATVTGNGMASRVTVYVYEPLGRLAVEERNAFGQVTRKILAWDAWGNPLAVDNIDNVRTTHAVDLMGRPFISYSATGTWNKTLHSAATTSYCPGGDTVTHSITSGGGQPLRYQCFDRLGREVRTATQGFDGGMIFVDRYFDLSGQPERVSEPYFAGSTRYWNLTAHDSLGRIDSVLAADGNDLTYLYDEAASACGVAGAVRQVETTNGLGQSRLEVRNPFGELTAVYDAACGKVTYEYNAAGSPVRLTGADGAVTSTTYDPVGRKVRLVDPDKGTWQYAYNALGEMIRQLDGKNQAVDFGYDLLGRVNDRQEITGASGLTPGNGTVRNREVTTWNNSTSGTARGKGQVTAAVYRSGLSGAILHQRSYGYDGFGRPGIVSTSMDGLTLAEETTYDQFGRVFQQFDASGDDRGLRYHYNARGYVEKLQESREGTSGLVYQHIRGMDARGNITYMVLGNGVEAFASHSESSGRIAELEAYDAGGGELQFVRYGFDVAGNLLYRHDTSGSNNLRESFGYDVLSRLENVFLAVNGGASQNTLALRYGKSGNIDFKSDVGNYLYGPSTARPHAATAAGSATYTYDANGNQVSSSTGRSITYTVFDQAQRLQKGSEYTEFSYGIGNERIKRSDSNAVDQSRTTRYFNGVERIEQNGGNAFFRRSVGDVAMAEYYPSTGSQAVSYLLKDHLGSIDRVVSSSGVSAMSFSAFGERRPANWEGFLGASLSRLANAATTSGFTGHEHADGLGVIHMNGRVYDPRLGRFLQADPLAQDPGNSQSLNRYSYVLNNPLSLTDPSGYFSLGKFISKWGRFIVAGVASYFTYGAATGWATGWLAGTALAGNTLAIGAIAGGIAGFVGGAIVSGTVRGAFQGVAAGAVMGGVAGYFGNTYSLERIAADSLAGGASAEIYGQEFRDGLLFGALIASATYINVKLRAWQKAWSARSPGQIGPSLKKWRGIDGRLGGERIFADWWVESGAAARFNSGEVTVAEAIENIYLPFRRGKGPLSPLGCFQGSAWGCVGSESFWTYDPSGSLRDRFANYIIEGYSGPHDALNSWLHYDRNGMNRNLTGFALGSSKVMNPLNVLIASPIVLPSLIPDYMRYMVYADE